MRNKFFNLIFISLFLVLTLSFILAEPIRDDLHLNIQTTNSSGHAIPGTYDFVFNISTSNNCTDYSSVVFTNSTTLTTDDRGVLSIYLYNITADFSNQHHLCYFRNSTLKDTVRLVNVPSSYFTGKVTPLNIFSTSSLFLSIMAFSTLSLVK